ncbi:PilX N-terminal domain-containing pilus assembly protein [Stenotrophomonas sp.]|jgi:type IV pilus assembly protein PilX|uniref:pilus assembly PilX family protein n=2 Tax=unclassified Stenotrophomonas TaxID=196198 RepID=UPI003342AF1A
MATEVIMASSRKPFTAPRRQDGAVLYVALIILILLALLGIAGMQVTGMQERMAANYLRTNLAFQSAEADARSMESTIEAQLAAGGTYSADQEECSPIFDPLTWADGTTDAQATYTRRMDKCVTAGSSGGLGGRENEDTGNIYQITALASDDPDNPSASAVVDTIYIP